MIKKWEYYDIDDSLVDEIANESNISKVLARVLVNRGIAKNDIEQFLNPKIEDLNDPFLLNDMELAVLRIIKAKEHEEKITIYGDYDVDGITSIAVLQKFLNELDMNVDYYLPSRLEEGYGLNNDALDSIKRNGTTLLITVDCGISAHEEIEYAKSIGLDVIVTDHHECPERIPEAIAIIDPKRRDSTYPFNGLAGVGVTFKLIQAISYKLGLDRKRYLKFLDIVCVGTVADIVPLIHENRVIVKFGLMLIAQTKNIGLRALIKISGYEEVNSRLISFGLAPRINACGRMGKADLALELLLTDDENKANQIANELNEINKERQTVEKTITEDALKIIENNKLYQNDVIVLGKCGWHHGVIGIVASKITESYYKPSILVCFENSIGKGSGRSVEGFDLHKALTICSSDLLKFGGHEMAIGLTINKNCIEKFSQDINEYASGIIDKEMVPTIKIDSEIGQEFILAENVRMLEKLEPYGESNCVPIFLIKNIKVDGIRLLSNNKHLKLILRTDNQIFDAIAFNMADRQYSFKVGDKIDILATLEINSFNNIEKVQFNIKDIKLSL